ncbi:MAG TPA: FtsX-like permease family protein [Noviherbaspirillum sp.]|jgi:putative ABC transport system permease protein|uniref:ABC transporter permease n=1 Tax=Noviherbaspirillum sp. TaxID=1926288 RepID=UPI002F943289
MSHLVLLALRSAWNRRLTLGLVVLTIALSVTMLLGVERLRHHAQEGFAQSVAGTDLIVGARSSPVQLLLFSVFHVGEPTGSMRWDSAMHIAAHPAVAWTIPLSLGDSHRGYPVLGTNGDYFLHYRHGDARALEFSSGRPFTRLFEAVLGAEVAERLGYRAGDRISLSHGMQEGALTAHDDKPFTVAGVLKRTGTPVDRTVHVSLEAIEAIHLDWQGGARLPGMQIPSEFVRKFDLSPKQISGMLVGLKSRAAVFRMQRHVIEYEGEALLAILPGVALGQLWQVVGVVEQSLLLVSALVVLVGLCGLVAVVLAGLNERRRELAILRSVGAQPADIFLMLVIEGFALACAGCALGLLLLSLGGAAIAPFAEAHFGLSLPLALLSAQELPLLAAVLATAVLASLVPGYRAYRLSLADGLTPRL